MAGARPTLLLLALFLGCATAPWAVCVAAPVADTSPTLNAMLEWVYKNGGSSPGAFVGQACPTCPRGVFASKALKRGDVVMTVPLSLALAVSQHTNLTADPAAYAAGEYARELLLRLHTDPSFNATFGTYWATLPQQLFRAELFEGRHKEMLQSPSMVAAADAWRQQSEMVYNGSFTSSFIQTTYPPLVEELPHVTIGEFLRVVALIFTRTFTPHVGGDMQIFSPYLLPLVDLLNHADDPNAFYTIARGAYHVLASRAVQKGEELTLNYKSNNLHRPDGAIMGYGFTPASETPLLCSFDLPPGFNGAAQTDPAYEDPDSPYASVAERDRLAALLATAPTSEGEDAAALASDEYDWREREVLKFRVMRKRAVRQALEKLGATLTAKGTGAGADGGSVPAAAAGAAEGSAGSEAAGGGEADDDDEYAGDDEL